MFWLILIELLWEGTNCVKNLFELQNTNILAEFITLDVNCFINVYSRLTSNDIHQSLHRRWVLKYQTIQRSQMCTTWSLPFYSISSTVVHCTPTNLLFIGTQFDAQNASRCIMYYNLTITTATMLNHLNIEIYFTKINSYRSDAFQICYMLSSQNRFALYACFVWLGGSRECVFILSFIIFANVLN